MSNHTPGPWTVEPTGESSIHGPTVSIDASPLKIVARPDWHGDHDEYMANARLIAAAPNLLKALDNMTSIAETALRHMDYADFGFKSHAEAEQQIRDAVLAISKAEGLTPPKQEVDSA